jgi:hypothetical protein
MAAPTNYFSDYNIPAGNLANLSNFRKYGRVPALAAGVQDVWPGGGLWIPPLSSSGAQVHFIVSSDLNDDVALTGCQSVRIFGLTSWATGTPVTDEVVIMNGIIAVPTINSYVMINRMRARDYGIHPGGPNVGNITATAAIDGTVTAVMPPAVGSTLQAIYGVPAGVDILLAKWWATLNTQGAAMGDADVTLKFVNPVNRDNPTFITLETCGLVVAGNSRFDQPFSPYERVPGPAVVKISVEGALNADVSGGFMPVDHLVNTNV